MSRGSRLSGRYLWPLVISAAVLGGCGGSGSSNAERTKLVHQLTSQLGGLPPALVACVGHSADGLPISQLRDLAKSSATASPATKQVAVRLVIGCISRGNGVAAFRTAIVKQIAAALPSTLPASFRTCVEDKANAVPAAQIAGLFARYQTVGSTAASGEGAQLGRQLAISCLSQPAVLSGLRAVFLKPIQSFAQTSHYSKAFRDCVLQKAEHVSASTIEQFALHPAGATAAGSALGAGFARACIASGVRP